MSQKDWIVQNIKFKQTAIVDLSELYKHMWRWFDLYGYDVFETEYRDSDEPEGKHLEIKWYAEKKVDDYVKFVIKTSFLVTGMTKVEIERQGQKIGANKGTLEIKFDAFLEKDYDDKWTGPIQRFLREIYDKLLIKKRIENYEDMLNTELYKYIDELKAFVNVHRF